MYKLEERTVSGLIWDGKNNDELREYLRHELGDNLTSLRFVSSSHGWVAEVEHLGSGADAGEEFELTINPGDFVSVDGVVIVLSSDELPSEFRNPADARIRAVPLPKGFDLIGPDSDGDYTLSCASGGVSVVVRDHEHSNFGSKLETLRLRIALTEALRGECHEDKPVPGSFQGNLLAAIKLANEMALKQDIRTCDRYLITASQMIGYHLRNTNKDQT